MQLRGSWWTAVSFALSFSLSLWCCSGEERPDQAVMTPRTLPTAAAGGSAGLGATEPAPAAVLADAGGPSGGEGNPLPGELVGQGGAPVSAAPDAGAPPLAPTPFAGNFILGADISSIDETVDFGSVFVDTDGQEKSLIEILKNHGFNYIRLRTFVDPLAEYGYASASACPGKSEAYADAAHTIAFAQQIKADGLGFLLDFHYSDTWADPGKQVIPEAWRGLDSTEALAEQVRSYTVEVVSALVAAGARPDMVQVGNEITPGMLIHVPTADTDCYGNNSVPRPGVNGSQADWDNLAALLRAGIDAVRSVDPSISVMLHIENTESASGVSDWVANAQQRGVEFDVLGLSAYEAFQGPASAWRTTLLTLAQTFPDLGFAIAEYNPQRRLVNDIMREIPNGRGLGTFFWEPTQSGAWGSALFTWEGNRATANAADFAEYDQMKVDYGL
jgi:arabinogalactan endo-1,4-beta-galactosidase